MPQTTGGVVRYGGVEGRSAHADTLGAQTTVAKRAGPLPSDGAVTVCVDLPKDGSPYVVRHGRQQAP